ncbi:MAG: glycosyltransferase [Deltaproteobacteria bacterium]|nr:glycosyltransferase [Deltaproteobacteria bacterium]
MPVFPNLPIEPSGSEQRAARVCIATYEILGPSRNGGIGTAYYSLATTLAAANHHVTILYLWAGRSDAIELQYWESYFRTLGIVFVPLPASMSIATVPDCIRTACDAYAWLRKRQFDIVHFPELHGHGYYCVLAKHQGLDFARTILCIGTHSPISWIREQNKEAPYSPEELEMDFMERQCVALADIVVSPSQYMLGWMRSRDWILPAACYVQQNIAPAESKATANLARRRGEVQPAGELVFFGRLEARKGIVLFCDALDHIQGANLPAFSVTFLGKNGQVAGRDAVSYIKARSEHWGFPHRILTDYGREAALQFLAEDRRIAIIPSFEDNLPYTILECLAASVPFLAGRGGGIPELIARSDLEQVTFPPDAIQLAGRLAHAIRNGVPMARPAIDPDENKQRWINWHSALDSHHYGSLQMQESAYSVPAQPLVTVCVNYRGDCELLRQSLSSLRRQSYSRLEVLLSDHSPTGAEAELHRVTHEFELKGWRLIPGAKPDHNGTRSDAAAGARGDYILLIEASDYLNPDAVATFVKVASRTGAEVITCFLALFAGVQEPAEERCLGYYPFLGGAVLSGVFRNYFGLRAIFVQRDALLRLGSFPSDSRRDCADWEFLASAALMHCRMEVIPVPLVWYRIGDESGPHAPINYLDQVQALAPYAQAMPAALRDLPKAAFTTGLHYQRMRERMGDSPIHSILRRLSANRNEGNQVSGLADEGALLRTINQMPSRSRKKIVLMLDGWLDYSSARARLPPPGFQRLSHIARQLVRGHYHRYGHGFGSALRDLRKPARPEKQSGPFRPMDV